MSQAKGENEALIPYFLSLVHYPLSSILYLLYPNPYPPSPIHYPLSIIPYTLSIIPYPLSHISNPLSIIPFPLSLTYNTFKLSCITASKFQFTIEKGCIQTDMSGSQSCFATKNGAPHLDVFDFCPYLTLLLVASVTSIISWGGRVLLTRQHLKLSVGLFMHPNNDVDHHLLNGVHQ